MGVLFQVAEILGAVADEPSQHLISSFKYLDPHFHSQTICLSIVNMNMHRNNGKPLELRMHIYSSSHSQTSQAKLRFRQKIQEIMELHVPENQIH